MWSGWGGGGSGVGGGGGCGDSDISPRPSTILTPTDVTPPVSVNLTHAMADSEETGCLSSIDVLLLVYMNMDQGRRDFQGGGVFFNVFFFFKKDLFALVSFLTLCIGNVRLLRPPFLRPWLILGLSWEKLCARYWLVTGCPVWLEIPWYQTQRLSKTKIWEGEMIHTSITNKIVLIYWNPLSESL